MRINAKIGTMPICVYKVKGKKKLPIIDERIEVREVVLKDKWQVCIVDDIKDNAVFDKIYFLSYL